MERIQFACQKLDFIQECANPGRQVAHPNEFYKMAPNFCESLVWDLLHATVLAPRILRSILDFWKSLAHLI
jgi:hypothetical protein